MRNINKIWILLIVMALCTTAYALTLQGTGQSAQAERFVEWAGGGLMTITVLVWLFGGG